MSPGPCTYCRREMDPTGTRSLLERTADHVIPQCRGGALGRTVPGCWHCNNLKGQKSPEQWDNFMRSNPRWWENPQFKRQRNAPVLTAPETAAWLRRKGIEASFANAQPCTNHFLPAGYELKDPNTGETIGILGEDRKFKAAG